MAAVVQAVEETIIATLGTNHVLNVPASAVDGDRLLAIVSMGKNQLSPGTTWPGPWDEEVDITSTEGNGITLSAAWMDVEGTAPGTVNATTVNNCRATAAILRIDGHDPATPPEFSALTDTSNPPSLSPSWGSESTLFGTAYSSNEDPFPFPAYPLPDHQHDVIGTSCVLYMCTQVLNAASCDPGTWQSGSPEASGRSVLTFAVRAAAAGVDLAQLSEVDSLGAITRSKSKAVAQLTDVSSLFALTVFKSQLIAQLTGLNELLALPGGVKTMALGGVLTEVDTLLSVAASATLLQAQESDELLALVGGVKSKLLAQLSTIDTLQALGASKSKALAQILEADALGAVGFQQVLDQLLEIDALQPLIGGVPLPDDAHATSASGLMPGTIIGAPGLKMVASATSIGGLSTAELTGGLET